MLTARYQRLQTLVTGREREEYRLWLRGEKALQPAFLTFFQHTHYTKIPKINQSV